MAAVATVLIAVASSMAAEGRMVVGYFPQWGVYNQWFAGDLVHSGAAAQLTQLNYAQAFIRNNECVVADPMADMQLTYTEHNSVDGIADTAKDSLKGNFHQLQKLHTLYPQMRMVISLEGKAADFIAASQPAVRQTFVRSCIERFVQGHLASGVEAPGLFDGFDLDWEYPTSTDNQNFLALLQEFRKQLDAVRPGLTLAVAAGAGHQHVAAVDWQQAASFLDQVGVMTYDYNGPWDKQTGFVAPLRSSDPTDASASTAIADFVQHGVPRSKLLLGIPFYAYEWTDVPAGEHNGYGQAGTPVHDDLNYQTVVQLLASSPDAKVYRDPISKAPWVYDGKDFLTYDDAASLREKSRFVEEQKLAGVMIWELSGSDASGTMLRALGSE